MWILGSIAAIVGLAAVVVAFVVDPAAPRRQLPGPARGLPRPAELTSRTFPSVRLGGYDPRAVDTCMAELAAAYEALYLAAGPSSIAHAEAMLTGASDATDASELS